MNQIGVTFLLAFLCLFSGMGAESSVAPANTPGRKVRLYKQAGDWMAEIGGKQVSLKGLTIGGTPVTLNGVSFAAAANGGFQILSDADVSVQCSDIKGWSAVLPADVTSTLQLDTDKQRVALAMPPGSTKSGYLFCDVGGKVELKAGAQGQLDFFKNNSYLFKGSGPLIAVNDDGLPVDLTVPGSTMSGGALVMSKDADGREHWDRTSPTTAVKVSGTPGTDLEINIGGTIYKPVDGNVSITVPDTGATIKFTEKTDGSVSWIVDKGDFRVSVAGVPGMTVFAESGDAANMSWDAGRKMAQVINNTSQPLDVAMPGRSTAVVSSSTQFQYSIPARGIFSTASSGGNVSIYNGDSKKISDLPGGNLLLDAKTLTAGLTSGNGLLMRLAWDNGVPLNANSDYLSAQVQPGTEKILKFGTDGEAKLTYAAGGFLTVEAIRSNFKLGVEAVHGLSIDLVEGDTVSLTLDLKKETFTVKAGEQNVNDVAVETQNGYTPVLEAARALNFNLGQQGAMLASSGGQPVFFQSAPGDPTSQNLTPPPPYSGTDQTQLTPPNQQPVSPSR